MHEGRGHAHLRAEPLVRVDDHRVGHLQAVVEFVYARIENAGQAVGAVDVHPDILLTGNLADRCEWVDGAGICGAGVGNNRYRQHPFSPILVDRGLKCIDAHAPPGIAIDRPDRSPAEPEHAGRTLDRAMAFAACVDRGSAVDAVARRIATDFLEGRLTGAAETDQIGDGTATRVDAFHAAEVEQLSHPVEREFLDQVECGQRIL